MESDYWVGICRECHGPLALHQYPQAPSTKLHRKALPCLHPFIKTKSGASQFHCLTTASRQGLRNEGGGRGAIDKFGPQNEHGGWYGDNCIHSVVGF